ncbi:PID-CTERM protein-sorting domain-containing protein [Peijinzhouia sedimentorum]
MKIAILTFSLLFLSLLSYAQTFGGPPSFAPDVLDNPIDGGLSLLLGVGAAYGAKKLRDNRKNKMNEEDQN